MKNLIFLLSLTVLASGQAFRSEPLANPSADGSVQPSWSAAPDGSAILSWIEPVKNGDYSHPVRTRYGFHIIKVEDKKVGAPKSCDDEQVKTQVQNELYNRELERQLKLWVDELRKKAYVDVKI